MKLFSLTQSLFGFYHEREDDHWVRKRNGRTLHPGDRYHPDTYRTESQFYRKRPQETQYEPDDLHILEFYAPSPQRSRPSGPVIIYGEPRSNGGRLHEQLSYERLVHRSISQHPPLRQRARLSIDNHDLLETRRPRQPLRRHASDARRSPALRPMSPQPQRARRGRALTSPASPISTSSTLVASVYEPESDHIRETHYRSLPEPPRPERRQVRFASPTLIPSTPHTESVNPLIDSIHVNPQYPDASTALSRLENLAFIIYPIMHKFNLRVDCLVELAESVSDINSWNSGQGKEIRIKVRSRGRRWRSMDEMVGSMLDELAHNVYSERGREWWALRDQLRREVGRLA